MFESTFITPPIFWVPEHLKEPDAWVGHIPFAFWLVDALQPQKIVELGTYTGNSYLAFCQGVEKLNLNTACFAIDTWKGDDHSGSYSEEVFIELAEYHEQKYSKFSQLIRCTFDEAVDNFLDKTIDLLHLDGLHTYETVKHNFETWLPKVSDKGIIIFHNTTVKYNNFGVGQFWDELKDKYPSFSFVHSHGLGVLGVGHNWPDPIQKLFNLEKNSALGELIRHHFSHLGSSLIDKLEKQRLSEQLQLTQNQLNQVHLEWENCQTQLRQVQKELEQSQAELEPAQNQLQQALQTTELSQARLKEAQENWQKAHAIIQAMESSKLWQLRQLWLKTKLALGLKA